MSYISNMQDDSQEELERLISEGQHLLDSYKIEKDNLKSSGKELSDIVVSEFAGALVGEAFGSRRLGNKARSLSKSSLKSGKAKQVQELDERFLQFANIWISKVCNLLEHISIITNSKRQNSQKLLSMFSKVESVVRLDTKLRKGISTLKGFTMKGVVGNKVIDVPKTKGIVTGPGDQFAAYKRVLEIAANAQGQLIVVDPYPGQETLVVLQTLPKILPVKFLTSPPQRKSDRSEFEILARKLMIDRPETEIRYAPEKSLHDRFMITKTEAWHLGHSIKDIGNRLSAITQMDVTERKQFENGFSVIWDSSSPV